MAVFHPEVAGLNRVQDCPEQRAFLRMAIFARKDIGDHTQGRYIDHQRCAGHGTPRGFTPFFHAMLTGFEAVAIDACDPIALKPRGVFTAHVRDARGERALSRTSSAVVCVSKPLSLLETATSEVPTSFWCAWEAARTEGCPHKTTWFIRS